MAMTFIAQVEGFSASGTGQSSLATSSTLTLQVGDVLHVALGFEATGGGLGSDVSITSVSDNAGGGGAANTYSFLTRIAHSSTATEMGIAVYRCIVTRSGTATVTAAFGGGFLPAWCNIRVEQFRPSGTASADTSASAQGTGTAISISSVSIASCTARRTRRSLKGFLPLAVLP